MNLRAGWHRLGRIRWGGYWFRSRSDRRHRVHHHARPGTPIGGIVAEEVAISAIGAGIAMSAVAAGQSQRAAAQQNQAARDDACSATNPFESHLTLLGMRRRSPLWFLSSYSVLTVATSMNPQRRFSPQSIAIFELPARRREGREPPVSAGENWVAPLPLHYS